MANSKAPFSFGDEKRITGFIHDLKVFIAGADVTAYLTGSLSVTYGDRDGTNTCSFNLSNHNRAFEMTEANMNNNFRLGDNPNQSLVLDPGTPQGRSSELAKYIIYTNKQKNNVSLAVSTFGPVKDSQQDKAGVLNSSRYSRDASGASSTTTKRYPFNVGSLVLHKFDPVRVFVRDPLGQADDEVQRGGSNRWVNVFTGYVDLKPYTQDFTDGNSFIKVTCQDIRMLMRNMRTQMNPSVQAGMENTIYFTGAGKTVTDQPDAGFFNDLVSPTTQISHVLGGLSWKESVKFLLQGIEYTQPGVKAGTSANRPNPRLGAVGKLTTKDAVTLRYDPKDENRAAVLQDWNNLILFGSKRSYMTLAEVMKTGAETKDGGTASPDIAFIHFLEPPTGSPPSNLVEYNFSAQPNGRPEWSSRLELLQSLCRSVDYQMYVTGCGDYVFEFPMYDFMPDDYGVVYKSLYTFEKHVVSDNINDEGGTPLWITCHY